MFDSLEPRRLFAASITLSDGVLTIRGTNNPELISPKIEGDNIVGNIVGVLRKEFKLSRVDKVVIKGGGGDDFITMLNAGTFPSSIRGGDGNDFINGGHGNDTIHGDAGKDDIQPEGGRDKCYGDDGNDMFRDNRRLSISNKDVYAGGSGRDLVTYYARSEDLRITLDGEANDGAAGERDNVMPDVEDIECASGNDIIIGNSRDNRIWGGGGDDRIEGKGGNDRLWADLPTGTGLGQDTLLGGDGDDILYANDSTADTVNGGDGDDRALLGPGGNPGIDLSLNNETQRYF